MIKFSLPKFSHVEMFVINVLGQRVRTLIDEEIKAGFHQTVWDRKNDGTVDVSSGIYFITMHCGEVKKMRKTCW